MEMIPVFGQKMVVEHIYDDPGVVPVFGAKPILTFFHYRVAIGEMVDGSVQPYAFYDIRSVDTCEVATFYKIAHKVADHELVIFAGQAEVSQKIQWNTVLRSM